MQNTVTFNFSPYIQLIKKYWFQLSLILLVLYVFGSKEFSFELNMNSPDTQNTTVPALPDSNKNKPRELLTKKQKQPRVAKSEATLFSKIPFLGGSSKKKSELAHVEESIVEAYLQRFAHVAINERKKYGVPSSIILANGLFHSFAGKRDIALSGNNHFGIQCSEDWAGQNGTYEGSCFRHYENAWTSFRDHSLFVTSGSYAELRKLSSTDYKSWAKQLEAKSFSEFEDLEDNLIQLIEKYGLHHLDLK